MPAMAGYGRLRAVMTLMPAMAGYGRLYGPPGPAMAGYGPPGPTMGLQALLPYYRALGPYCIPRRPLRTVYRPVHRPVHCVAN